MTIKELESRLQPGAILSLAGKAKAIGGGKYRVDPCPICGHKEHFTIYSETNSFTTFADCSGGKKGGGVYRYLIDISGLTEDEARAKIEEMAGYIPEIQEKTEKKEAPAMIESMEQEPAQPLNDYTKLVTRLYDNQLPETRAYFISRGIGQALIDQYKLSVFKDQDGRRAMLPVWKDGKVIYFTKRALDGQEPRYKNATGQAPLFNLPELEAAQAGDSIVITEGIFDALTVEENSGLKAVALGGVEHYPKAAKAIQEAQDRGVIVLTAFDNDEAGIKAQEAAGLPAIRIPASYKDINEWSLEDPAAVSETIIKAIEQEQRPEAGSSYLDHGFFQAIERFKSYQGRETGFINLDHHLGGFFPGLYVIGGVSSVGKTTFAHQLGDQLAEQGDHVLYYSLEQSRFEMTAKSIARETAKIDLTQAVTNISIRSGLNEGIVKKAVANYRETAQRMSIIEGNFEMTVAEIRKYIGRYIARNNVKPVVIIDYLQILPGDPRMSDKQRIDSNVTELKRISRDYDIALIVISSLNRASYTAPVTFEAFKESGGIEYTADVILGLQLEAIREKFKDPEEKHERLKAAKEQTPRRIELVCLKNRNGKTFSCSFIYNQMFDYYSANTIAAARKAERL